MDGIHDLGGKQGFGKVPVEREYVPFRVRADGVSLALMMECTFDWPLDRARHVKELLPPVTYLSDPYFAGWAMTYIALLVQSGHVTADEIISGQVIGAPATPADRGDGTQPRYGGAIRRLHRRASGLCHRRLRHYSVSWCVGPHTSSLLRKGQARAGRCALRRTCLPG